MYFGGTEEENQQVHVNSKPGIIGEIGLIYESYGTSH